MSAPGVSVLMPVRDCVATVDAALRSTLRSLPAEAELLVFDDGSSDGTSERIRAYRDRRVRVWSDPSVTGIPPALNYLLSRAESSIVARMDGDDICLPHRFAFQRAALRRSSSRIVFGNVVHFGRSVPRVSLPVRYDSHFLERALLVSNPLIHGTMFGFAQEIASVGGYRESPAEDYDLWLRLAAAGVPMERSARPVLLYRHHGGQVSSSQAWRRRVAEDEHIRGARALLAQRIAPQLTEAIQVEADLQKPPITGSRARVERELGRLTRVEAYVLRRRIRRARKCATEPEHPDACPAET